MTKLLDEAIQQLRDLPEEEQDAAADALFAYISSDERQYVLRPEQAAEVRRRLANPSPNRIPAEQVFKRFRSSGE